MKFDNIEMQIDHMDEIDYTNKLYHMDEYFLNIFLCMDFITRM